MREQLGCSPGAVAAIRALRGRAQTDGFLFPVQMVMALTGDMWLVTRPGLGENEAGCMSTDARRNLTLADLLPPEWKDVQAVWLTVYRVMGLAQKDLEPPVMQTLADVSAVFVWGRLPYVIRKETEVHPDGVPEVRFHVVEGTVHGPWALLMTPTNVHVDSDDEARSRGRIETAVALLAVLGTRNLVFEKISDTAVVATGQTIGFGDPFENPAFFPTPDVQQPALDLFRSAMEGINGLPAAERNRIELSLGWIEQSQRGMNGADSFVKAWIALEILAMPDWDNLTPMNEALAQAYGIGVQEARDRFEVGRLFGLRGQILHAGRTAVDARVIAYASCLYQDLLRGKLGLQFVGSAGGWLMGNGPPRTVI